MENNNYLQTWEQAKHVRDNNKLDIGMITQNLRPKVSRIYWNFYVNLLFYLAAILASIIFLSMNLVGYRNNPVMLSVEAAFLILSVLFLGFGFFIFLRIREINNFSQNLGELLRSKIKFLRVHYEIWLIFTAIVTWILAFSLESFVDNQNGFYRINKVGVFVITTLIMLVFIYGVQKISIEISLRTLKAYLADLESGYLDRSEHIEKQRKNWKWLGIAVIILLVIMLILGILKAI